MSRHLPAVTAPIFLMLALVLAKPLGAGEPALADQPTLTPQSGLLVLRNGRVLAGDVTRAGDRFLVAVGEQDEVTVPTTAVEFFCRDLEQAYELKQAAVRFGNLADVLDLAEWCLRHELHREAAEQVLRALVLDRDDPRIGRMERRLQVALEARAEPVPISTVARPTVSVGEIEKSLSDLPPGTIERFTSQVQPLLLNRCGAGRCHGPQSSSGYQLTHAISGHRLPTQMTHRNLFQTLKHVDRKEPQNSRLLTVPAGPHGDLVVPVFNDHEQDKWQQLQGWVHGLAALPVSPPPATITRTDTILLQPTGAGDNQPTRLGAPRISPVEAGMPANSQVVRAAFESTVDPQSVPAGAGGQPPGSPQLGSPQLGSPQPGSPQRSVPQSQGPAGRPGTFVPRDPFDPELFNRRFFPSAQR